MPDSERRPLGEVPLPNGLTAHFYDFSRPVAGDRWQVRLLLVIPIPVIQEYFRDHSDPASACAASRAAFGETLEFTQERVRNFVDERDKVEILEKMKRELTETVLDYVSREAFAANYLAKRLQAHTEEATVRRRHAEMIAKMPDAD